MDEKFNLAVKTINSLHINPSNEINLKIYAYFKRRVKEISVSKDLPY